MNPVISRKLPPPSSLSLSLHSFLPPSFFSPPCSYTRHEPTTTRTGTTMGIPRVCTRSYPDIWPSPVSKCFPVAEGGGRVVPLILNCYVGFTSVSPSITSLDSQKHTLLELFFSFLTFLFARRGANKIPRFQGRASLLLPSSDLKHARTYTVNEAVKWDGYRDLNWKAPLRDLSP